MTPESQVKYLRSALPPHVQELLVLAENEGKINILHKLSTLLATGCNSHDLANFIVAEVQSMEKSEGKING